MIAFGKSENNARFNPMLGSSYCYINEGRLHLIRFWENGRMITEWNLKTKEKAQQTLEWLDQLYGVKFIPSQILETENKEND